ncbi:hypothetical protein IX332_000706 [Porphyromonas levii]|nr:hypothetical protein [Porphyromonas levii]MBR8730997.1 hypothetical protein [Porphyromonas levii]MBR8759042.1 hypothetical protein [Porphyromonas levii]
MNNSAIPFGYSRERRKFLLRGTGVSPLRDWSFSPEGLKSLRGGKNGRLGTTHLPKPNYRKRHKQGATHTFGT